MITSTIKPYPIRSIADQPINAQTLADALLSSVADYHAALKGRRIWLACSGGRDSLALAAACIQLYYQQRLPFLPQLLHVDHGLQAGSDEWAQHVARWADMQNIPCHILQAQVQGQDEQAARQARYKVMREHINQGDVLLLAHHADDQAETLLMRLIQGAGVKGLSGMQPWRVQDQAGQQMVLWRPWLSVRRSDITSYAEQLSLPYIDDPTNASGDNVRSGLRRDILPALANYNPNVVDNIARSAQLLSDAQLIVSAQAKRDLQQVAVQQLSYPPAIRVLDIERLNDLPPPRRRQLLHQWLAQDEPLPPTKQLVDDTIVLAQRQDNDHQSQLDWYAKQRAYSMRRYRHQLYRLSHTLLDWLTIPINEQSYSLDSLDSADKDPLIIPLRGDKRYGWQLEISWSHLQALIEQYATDHEPLALKLMPLARQQRIWTQGSTRAQSGKKLYQSLGIPVWLRDSLVVISLVSADHKHPELDLPLLLLSPVERWVLKDSIVKSIADKARSIQQAIDSKLQVK